MSRSRSNKVIARSAGATIVCDTCGLPKPFNEFRRRRGGTRDNRCKPCRGLSSKTYYDRNKQYVIIRQQAYNRGKPYTKEQLKAIKDLIDGGSDPSSYIESLDPVVEVK